MTSIITIIGNVAAGKSSAMEIVTNAVHGIAVNADDLFQTSDPFREQFLDDTPRWALANEAWLTLKRCQMLRKAIAENPNTTLVVDSGLLMSWVYTHSHFLSGKITQNEWDLYQELYSELTGDLYKNLYVVYLDYPLKTLVDRLKSRGRDYELEYYTEEYLSQLQMGLMELVDSLDKMKVQTVKIDNKDAADFVANIKDRERISAMITARLVEDRRV